MDIRVLRYFLTVAQEGSITKAAQALHITQPTLSRQLMELEEEVGASLFIRGKRQITLTEGGILFQQRIKEIVSLLDKTHRDLAAQEDLVGGIVSIGCVETIASMLLPEMIEKFTVLHPLVQYELYSADGDDIREKLDRGDIDIGILLEPVEAAKYDYIRLPFQETWGLVMRRDDPLAQREVIGAQDIVNLPLILSRRAIVQNEIANWFGLDPNQLNIVVFNNLLTNASLLIKRGIGYAATVSGAHSIREDGGLCFVPFSPERVTGHVLAWRKNRVFTAATSLFIQLVKGQCE
jgi:DNA-binding transcriptional LysR family regulator